MIAARDLTALCSRLARALAPPRGHYRPLHVGESAAGWLDDARAARLARMSEVFEAHRDSVRFVDGLDDEKARSAAIDRAARELGAAGELTAWRDERYAVAPEFGATPWFLVERSTRCVIRPHAAMQHRAGTPSNCV